MYFKDCVDEIFFMNLLSGTVAGASQVIVGHPFDTLKVRLQTGSSKGLFRCVIDMFKSEGLFSLYKGIGSPLMGIGFSNAILFSSNAHFLEKLVVYPMEINEKYSTKRFQNIALAGGLSGALMGIVNCPIELVKVRLQLEKGHQNIFQLSYKILKGPTGIRGLYKAFRITILREIPSFAMYFSTYDYIKNEHHSLKFFAGGIAGIAAWLPAYPQDVIKSNMQSLGGEANTINQIKKIYQTNGLRGFFRGFVPTLLRAFPANIATFVTYEWMMNNFK